MILPDLIDECIAQTDKLADADRAGDWPAAMIALRKANEALCDIAPLLVERGVKRGMTQKRMADLLGVRPRDLAGAKREFGRA
jgi:hypothetical protein